MILGGTRHPWAGLRPKLAILGLFLAIVGLCFTQKIRGEVLPINQFGGLNTDDDPLVVQPERSPDSQNVRTDEGPGVRPREGFIQFSTESSSNLWVFPVSNGDRYLITQSSGYLKATLGGTNFTIILGTVSLNAPVAATAFGDRFYWYSSDGGKYWDTTVVVATNTTFDFTQLVSHNGRCWGSGVTGDKRRIYVSKYLNCDDFTLKADPKEDDPTRLPVTGSLDENITVLYTSYRGALIWAKPSSFGAITGTKRSLFVNTEISNNIGSAYPRSFQNCDGRLRFLGTQSNVWELTENGIVSLTNQKERIQTLMDTVSQGDANSRIHTETTATDWNKGTRGLYVSTSSISGSVVYSTVAEPGDDWEDNDITNGKVWTPTINPTPEFHVEDGYLVWVTSSGFGSIYTQSVLTEATWYWSYKDLVSVGRSPDMYFMVPGIGDVDNQTTFQGYLVQITTSLGIDGNYRGNVTLLLSPTNSSGDWNVLVSSSFDVNAGGTNQAFNEMKNRIKVTRDSGGSFRIFRGLTDISLNSTPLEIELTATNNFFSSSTYFVIAGDVNKGDPYISSITVISPGLYTSTFTSQSFNVGTAITSWGTFETDETLNDGTILYDIYSDSDTSIDIKDGTSYVAKQNILNGSVPTIATGSYVLVSATFTRTYGDQKPILNAFSINWNEGSQIPTPSLWFDQRYLLGVAISTTSNNTTLVFDKNLQWQKWIGINMNSSVIYNSNAYFGNGSGIYQYGVGTDDAGESIQAFYKSKRFMPGGPNYSNILEDLYLITANSTATIQTSYYLDGISTEFSLPSRAMNSASGIQDYLMPFSDSLPMRARAIEFLWTVHAGVDWRILASNLYFKKDPIKTGN